MSNVVSNFKYSMYCEFIDFPLLILGCFFFNTVHAESLFPAVLPKPFNAI